MPRILLYASLFTFAAWTADAAEIRLKSEATCSGAVVRLKDVAEVTSANENEAAALDELTLFPVPSAGKVRTVRRGEIRELLVLSDVNMKAITLSGAEKLAIRRAGTQSPAIPQAAAREPVASAAVPTAFITPTTKVASRVSETASVALTPIVARPLERGTVLRAADLDFRPSAQQAFGAAPLTLEELVGKEVLRPLAAGQPITKDLVQSPRLVHRGDKVTVKSVAAGVVVSVSGKALEEGGQGDNILVEDSTTREKLVTRVTDFQIVEVLGTGVKKVR